MSQPTAQGPAASAPGASLPPNSIDLFTHMHLALIALFAVVVIVAIIAGMRFARRRRQGLKEVQADNALIEQAPDRPAPPTSPSAPPAEPLPVPTPPIMPPASAATSTATSAVAPESSPGDDPASGPVTQLKGLGPKLAAKLAELGVTTVGQVAALTDDEAIALDGRLGVFAGRLQRDRWQEQARFLAAGDRKGFEAVFGKL